MQSRPSWGRYPGTVQSVRRVAWLDEVPSIAAEAGLVLACGNNRSYGDSALNGDGTVADFSPLDRFVGFDAGRGIVQCESGVTIGEILRLALPRGWSLPVIPGTQFVTVGGAIANDVHGKNHGRSGTFAGCVRGLLLWRSAEGFVECSPDLHPELFAATLGGLGLTGAIVWVELQLRPQPATQLGVQTIPFANIEEFLALAASSEADWEYTVAWVDGLARGKGLGRGIFFRANHADQDDGPAETPAARSRWTVPFDFPSFALSAPSVRAFNALYRATHREGSARCGFAPFFFPLDSIGRWNRIYGRGGFLQHQCVVPLDAGRDAMTLLLTEIATAGEASFLSVLKTFGRVPSPGLLSFPREGVTLAMDFPMRGRSTLDLLDRLDVLVRDAGGAVYPAKDARMSPRMFRHSFPRLDEFRGHVDPRFSSSFWRRVNAAEARPMTQGASRKVFVAGATSAIAQALARLCAARGDALFLVARDPDRLQAVRLDLMARGAPVVETLVADLDVLERHPAIVEEAWSRMGGLDTALIAYGVLLDQQECRDLPAEAARQVHTNFVSPVSLITALAARFEARGAGSIVALGSVAGDRGRQSNYTYGASKGGLAIFLDGLRHRLAVRGVHVLTVKAGFVDTPMTRAFPKGALWAAPARVAEDILRAIDRRQAVLYTPWFWRWIMAVIRNLPRGILHRTKL